MFQNAYFFLCLFVEPFFIPNNLQRNVGPQFMIKDLYNLVQNTATSCQCHPAETGMQISRITDVKMLTERKKTKLGYIIVRCKA